MRSLLSLLLLIALYRTSGQNITWKGQVVRNNSLVSLSAVQPRVNVTTSAAQAPLVCWGITGGQWYQPSGVLFPLATPDPVTTPGGLGQRNVSGGVELYRGTPSVFPHGVQCCTNTTITFCVGMYTDLTLAVNISLPTSNPTNYALSVAATYGPNITGGVQFKLLTPTNVDPPVFQLTCNSTSSPPTNVLWTTNGSSVSNTSSQIVTDRPTSTYNNTLTVTGRAYGMYTCTVTTTCSPVCGGFTLNPRSTTSSLTVQAPPDPPTGVTAVQSGPTSVSVFWTAPISGGPVAIYDIYYVANGGPSTRGGSSTSTSYVLTNFQVGVQYNISVIAVGTYLPSQSASSVVIRDGCPLTNSCANKYVWPESEIGTVNKSYPCVQRRCGGTYSTGGQWEPVVITCATDYISCAISDLEDLLTAAVNSTKAAALLLKGIDNILDASHQTMTQIQDAARLLKILNYYSNNAIINETTVFTGRTFAIQLEDIACFTGRNFSVNLGSVDIALAQNTTIFRSAISSTRTDNTTASVLILSPSSNECTQNTTSIHRLTFYTFLQNSLFQSPEQENEGFKLGSIIISVGGNAVRLAEKLQFSFQVIKDAKNANLAQWINDSNQTGKWSTEESEKLSTQNNIVITEVKVRNNADKTKFYQGNFAMLLDLNPGSVTCPAAYVVTFIGTVLSIISLLFFLVTYLCSKPLRKSEHGTILINISCALLCLYIVFLMATYLKSVPALCGISAALVHYFMLVYFMWTASEAVFLFFKLVKVFGNNMNYFTLKVALISWLVPLGIVIISAGAGYRYYYHSNYCRASGLPFYLGFISPFLVIYVFDWIMFIVIMVSLCKQSSRSANVTADNGYTFRNNVIIAAGLALVLGLGWGFGLAASSHNINALACTFQFLFSVFVSCQGLLLLFFHGVRNKSAKKVWRSWIGLQSKSYTITMSMKPGERDAVQSRSDQTAANSQHTSSQENQPSVDSSCEEPSKAATTEEKLIDEGSFDASTEKYVISIEEKLPEKGVAQKKVPRSFLSLSLLKKDASGAMHLFRSESQVTKVLFSEKDEDDDNSDLK